MRQALVVFALSAVGKCILSQANISNPVIDLGYARYRGVYNASTGINTWYAIRYAAPPVGDLRWRPPINMEEISYIQGGDIIDATKPGPSCVQTMPVWQNVSRLRNKNVKMGEDCLLLDVSVPAKPSNATLAVMVQIHGGGYALGNSQLFRGDALVSHSKGSMIYVSIQYRLGPYGFLSSPALKANGTANAGLLDQRAALEWVQHHISVFGGDPDRVTIAGGSAGGGSVTAQMMMYGGGPGLESPPFRSAIAEYPWWQPFHDDTVLDAQYNHLLKATGCLDLHCLRSVSGDVLAAAAQQTYLLGYEANSGPLYGHGDFYWGPSVDGDIIRDLPSQAFQKGAFSFVALLTNHAGYEGYSFGNHSEVSPEDERIGLQTLFPTASGRFFDRLFELYPMESYNSTVWHRQAVFSDAIVNCPTQWISDAVGVLSVPAYKMIFNAGSQIHGATAPFLFDSAYGLSPKDNATLAQYMKDWYVSFVVHQDPNKESYLGANARQKPQWLVYSTIDRPVPPRAILSVEAGSISTVSDPDFNARCSFWRAQSAVSRN